MVELVKTRSRKEVPSRSETPTEESIIEERVEVAAVAKKLQEEPLKLREERDLKLREERDEALKLQEEATQKAKQESARQRVEMEAARQRAEEADRLIFREKMVQKQQQAAIVIQKRQRGVVERKKFGEHRAAKLAKETQTALNEARAAAEANAIPRLTGPGGLVRIREMEFVAAEARVKRAQEKLNAVKAEQCAKEIAEHKAVLEKAAEEQAVHEAREHVHAEAAAKAASAAREAERARQRERAEEEERRRMELDEFSKLKLEAQQRLERHGQLMQRKAKLDDIQQKLDDLHKEREVARQLEAERKEKALAEEAEATQRALNDTAQRLRVAEVDR